MTENAQTQQRMLLAIVTGADSDNVNTRWKKLPIPLLNCRVWVVYCVNAVLLS